MQKLKIGVLGVSNHFIKRIILPLKKTQHCEITGIASRSHEKSKSLSKQFDIPVAFETYQALIESPQIDMVYIPLPNHLHHKWIIEAAKAGKHILCEKPITLNYKQAIECVRTVNEHKVMLMEAFMYKFHPQWIYTKEVIKTNQIGNISYINTSFAYHNPSPENIRNIKEYGGGAIMDIGCYAISVPRFLLDKEPSRVISLSKTHDAFNTDFLCSGIMDFNGINANFAVSTLSQPNQRVEIIGSSGMVVIEVPFNTHVDAKSKINITTAQGSRIVEFEVCDQYGLMFDSFSRSIINNKPIDNTDLLNNMKIIDSIIKSAESNKWESV